MEGLISMHKLIGRLNVIEYLINVSSLNLSLFRNDTTLCLKFEYNEVFFKENSKNFF